MKFLDEVYRTSWSQKFQSVTSPYSPSEFRMASVFGTEFLCFSQYPDGHESEGHYGQPIPSCREDLFDESDSAAYWDWNTNDYDFTDQACQDFARTCSGRRGIWRGELMSQFVDSWGDDTLSKGYDTSNGSSGLEMMDEEQFDRYYNLDQEMDVQRGNEHNTWFGGLCFPCGFDDDYDKEEHKSLHNNNCEETALYDIIFGHWPCSLTAELENPSERN